MDAMEVMEMVFDKTFYFNAKVVKNGNYLTTKNTKKAQGSQSFV